MIGAGTFAEGVVYVVDKTRHKFERYGSKGNRLRENIGFPGGVVIADPEPPKPTLTEKDWADLLAGLVLVGIKTKLASGEPLTESQQAIYDKLTRADRE